MKLEKILDELSSFEKNSFLRIITKIIDESPKNSKEIEKILSDSNKDLKNIDNINIVKVFNLVEKEFSEQVSDDFVNAISQLDFVTDIIIKDGNCIMSREWLLRLYEKEIKNIAVKKKAFQKSIEGGDSDIDEKRIRDYKIYKACLYTAFTNDQKRNQSNKITNDEQTILITLSKQLGLSREEIKLINCMIFPIEKLDIDTVINSLKNVGIIFYSKKNHQVFVADEVVRILRKIRGKEVADKFTRRVLKQLREPQINLIARKHNIDWMEQPTEIKIKIIINEGISFSDILLNDIYKDETRISEKKNIINQLIEKDLQLPPKGITIEDKVQNLINYFEGIEKDEKIGITMDGYEKLLRELDECLPKLNEMVKSEFELQDENVLNGNYLIDYNIKPRDILDLMTKKDLEKFCTSKSIKKRGDDVLNILNSYKDAKNLYLENYENFGFRNINALKENGIKLKDAEIGIKFEELTKMIFTRLGFEVDENLRKELNTKKDKMDIVLNFGNNEISIIECKSTKESGYNKFSSVLRQIKSYKDLAQRKEFRVIKTLLVAPDFSDEFINDCELDFELNLSLLTASTLKNILQIYKKHSKLKQFPFELLRRDVLINEERILKALKK